MHLIQPEAVLTTSRLLLEPILPSHAPALYESLQHTSIYEFLPEYPPKSVEQLTQRYQQLSARRSPDGQQVWLNWALRLREQEKYIGILQATILADMTAYLAYMLFPEFWRQGYAKEGCRRILSLLFEDYQVQSVFADIDTRNIASINLVESLGFQRIVTRLNGDFFKGSVSHEYQYELRSNDLVP